MGDAMRIGLVVAGLFALCGAAQAAIVVGVEARAGEVVMARESFEPPVTRVYGLASVGVSGPGFAEVSTTDHSCSTRCISAPDALAVTEVDADVMRWRVFAKNGELTGSGFASFFLTDQLVDRGPPGLLRTIDIDVRIELDRLVADRGSAPDADAGFSYGVYLPAVDETGPTPLFTFDAFAAEVAGEGTTRGYRVQMFGADPIEAIDIPSVFTATVSVPRIFFLASDFQIEVRGQAGAQADASGSASVVAYDSAWLGIRIDGRVAESVNGYGYIGYVAPGAAVPEPSTWALLLASAAAASRSARRKGA